MIPRALKFVVYRNIDDHLRQGWMVAIPNAPMHHHYYGIELKWICPCPVPGGFSVPNRVPNNTNQENAHERTEHRPQ